ncbi:MAG: YgjV family protein [Alphaproteobacteria bacterium]|nr:YgjV family protein [Alphaproteobacteria bacterium]
MATHLIVGNIFSLFAAFCIVISVVKKSKKDLILWQLWSIILSTFSCLALYAYAAVITCIMDLIRNALAYKDKLSLKITLILVVLCIIFGLWINNLGIIGILAIVASSSYTIFMYTTKNEQQMRWAFVFNQLLWLIHDIYIQAYPSAITDLVLASWTLFQIYRNSRNNVLT